MVLGNGVRRNTRPQLGVESLIVVFIPTSINGDGDCDSCVDDDDGDGGDGNVDG